MTLAAGSRLGPYEILSPIGAGGMGEVYRARDTRLSRDVAVKVLPENLASDQVALSRFASEARAVAALSHPNILAIHDLGEADGVHYAVMELLEGETVADRIERSVVPWRKAVEIATAIADGLSAAHARGIIHRDLKPENLFLTSQGHVKILDFGLARLAPPLPAGSQTSVPTTPVHTAPGYVIGTIGYLAPEQIRGATADARSDIFSFGCVLYEMVAGAKPFTRETAAETMAAILREEPVDPASLGRTVPPELVRLIGHCLEKNPDERFQTARDLAYSLRALMAGSIATSATHGFPIPRRRGRLRLLALGAAALALAAAGGFVAGHRTGRLAGAAPPEFQQLTYRRGSIWSARFAPGSRMIVFSATWDGNPLEIFSSRPEFPESRSLGLAGAEILAISRSGEMAICLQARHLAHLVVSGTLARVPLSGGTPREILEDVQWASWSPAGKDLAVVHEVSGRSRLEYPVGRVLAETSGWISHPRFSPAGDAIAFLEHPAKWDDHGTVAMVDLQGRKRTLTGTWSSEEGLAWSAEGSEIWFAAAAAGVTRGIFGVDLRGRQRVVGRVAGGLTLQDISPDGEALVTRDNWRSGILAFTPDQGRERDLSWLDGSAAGDLTADGRTILFHDYGEAAGPNYAVCIRTTDGSPPVRLGDGRAIALSPDGKWAIGILPTTPEQPMLLPTGPGQPRPLPRGGLASYQWASWFPDGQRIVLAAREAGRGMRLYVQDVPDGLPRALGPEGYGLRSSHAVSPDGRWIAAVGPDARPALVPSSGGGAPRPIPGTQPGELQCQWSPDGRFAYVFAADEGSARVDRIELGSGRREPWKQIRPLDPAGLIQIAGIRLTPDGRSYVYTYDRRLSDLYLVRGWN